MNFLSKIKKNKKYAFLVLFVLFATAGITVGAVFIGNKDVINKKYYVIVNEKNKTITLSNLQKFKNSDVMCELWSGSGEKNLVGIPIFQKDNNFHFLNVIKDKNSTSLKINYTSAFFDNRGFMVETLEDRQKHHYDFSISINLDNEEGEWSSIYWSNNVKFIK